MNFNNDNESKNNMENNMENKLNSLSSRFQSGLKSLTSSSNNDNKNTMFSDLDNDSAASSNNIMGMNWKYIILIIFIFGLLGVNIFVYLAVGTQDIINLFKPITSAITQFLQNVFGGSIASIFRNAIQGVYDLLYIAQGTIKGGVSAADRLTSEQSGNSSLNKVLNPQYNPLPSTQSYTQPTSLPQSVASNGSISDNTVSNAPNSANTIATNMNPQQAPLQSIAAQNVANTIPVANTLNNNALNNALNTALIQDTTGKLNTMSGGSSGTNTFNYMADDSMSNIQQSKSSSKSGWCFIGEDRGFRSCIQVNDNEKCMSGDIFPSQEICINPNLRQ
jgi:hypothetical protein